jgi:HEAT repeat protein
VESYEDVRAGLKSAETVRRLRSAWQLGELFPSSQEAIPLLQGAVGDEDGDVRGTAAEALGKIGATHQEAVAILLPLLASPDATDFRARVAYALGRAGPNSAGGIRSLVEVIEGRDSHARWAALLSLGEIGPQSSEVLPVLGVALKDLSSAHRFVAAWALGHIGNQASAIVPALERLQDDLHPLVAQTARWALGEIEPLRHPFEPVRNARFPKPDSQAIESMRGTISDGDRASRLDALWRAGDLAPGAGALIPELARLLCDPDPEFQGAAAESLGKIGWGSAAAIKALADKLSDESSPIRAQVAYALGWMGPEARRAIPALMCFFRASAGFTHKQLEARWAAACTLGFLRLPEPRLIEEFIRMLSDPESDVRFIAAESLGCLGRKAASASAALQQATADPHFTVRRRALRALEKIRLSEG